MQNAKLYLKENNIFPAISFKDKQAHILKLISDSKKTIIDARGAEINGLEVIVEENGEKKKFFTASKKLISDLSMCEENEIVQIKMIQKGMKSSYEIKKVNFTKKSQPVNPTAQDNNIPIPAATPEMVGEAQGQEAVPENIPF